MSFKSDLKKFNAKTEKKIEQAYRAAVTQLFNSIVISSPVGNTSLWQTKYPPSDYVGGRFRANWNTSIGRPDLSTGRKPDKHASGAKAQMRSTLNRFDVGQTVWFTNNLPYAHALENGHSTQRPHGMVKVNLKSWQSAMDKAANKVKNK